MATDFLDVTSFSQKATSQSLAPKPRVYIQLILCHAALWSSLSFGSLTVDALQHSIAIPDEASQIVHSYCTPTGLAERQLLSDAIETPFMQIVKLLMAISDIQSGDHHRKDS